MILLWFPFCLMLQCVWCIWLMTHGNLFEVKTLELFPNCFSFSKSLWILRFYPFFLASSNRCHWVFSSSFLAQTAKWWNTTHSPTLTDVKSNKRLLLFTYIVCSSLSLSLSPSSLFSFVKNQSIDGTKWNFYPQLSMLYINSTPL